ncbi:MAG: ORF6N domain-containing protein [Opitutaceae bacterium]|nr:ORF6N domain-containing protein [Opitutaceae bacterium]
MKRNREKFLSDFMFVLTRKEALDLQHLRQQEDAILRSQIVTLKHGRHVKHLPYAFTEHGALMAANILNSPQAVHGVRQHGDGVVKRSKTARR